MTLDQLRIFLAVAEHAHLTRAAAALSLTPSAVSASIKALEARYGLALFDRVGRGIVLSAAGRSLLPEARNTLASARATETTLEEIGQGRRGSLRIDASQTIASYWLAPYLVQFRQSHPAVDLEVRIGNTASVAAAVLDGSCEMGLVEGDIGATALQVSLIGSDRFAIVVAPDHPWADGRPLAPAALLDGRWIMREAGSGTRSAFAAMLAAIGVDSSRLEVALTLPSNEALRTAVMAGPFAAALSTLAVDADLRAGLLRQANLALPPRPLFLLRHPQRYQSQAARALEQLIKAS